MNCLECEMDNWNRGYEQGGNDILDKFMERILSEDGNNEIIWRNKKYILQIKEKINE